jgi:hypothetical protein
MFLRMGLVRQTARWFFFAALAVAPWFYGGTTANSINVINWLLGAAFLLWLTELIVTRRFPKFPRLLVLLVIALLAIGGWMVLNAHAILDAEFGRFVPLQNLLPDAPGSYDYALSAAWMIRAALLLMSILYVVDLSQSDRGLLHLWYAIGAIGGSICLLGLLEKATGAQMIFWQKPIGDSKDIYPFFASYYYHANAGAFLNLVLPLTSGLALRTFTSPATAATRALWLIVFALNLAAVASNTSRGAQIVGGFLLLALLIQLGPILVRQMSRAELNVAFAGAAAILFLLYALAQASHLEKSRKRWENFSEQMSENGRVQVSRVAMEIVPKAGLLGFGPGVFRSVFPYFNAQTPNRVTGYWRFLHEDYLQTLIEWGWLGTALWIFLFGGGMATAFRSAARQRRIRRAAESDVRERVRAREWSPRRRLIVPLATIALAGVALHAIVDFPLQIYSIQLYVASYLGVCWGSAVWK